MLCCNATAGQKILSMLPSFRRIMTTALFPLFSMTTWSLQYQAERTLSAFFHTMDCIRSWKRTEMVEHRASQDLSLDSVGLVAPLASSQLGTLLFWKNRWAGSFWFGIVLIRSYCLISLTKLRFVRQPTLPMVLSGCEAQNAQKKPKFLSYYASLRADRSKRSGISSATE